MRFRFVEIRIWNQRRKNGIQMKSRNHIWIIHDVYTRMYLNFSRFRERNQPVWNISDKYPLKIVYCSDNYVENGIEIIRNIVRGFVFFFSNCPGTSSFIIIYIINNFFSFPILSGSNDSTSSVSG